MDNFKRQFKQGDDYCDIRADYRSLISIGKSVEETEDLLLRAYCPKEGDLLFTPTFWLSLGICEWETGRLTPRTKEEALYCLSLYQETVEQRLNAGPNERLSDMLQFFRETQEMLLSPLPEAKKISKPYARKCPWREGSLLAYQILSPDMKNSPYYQKYVLLRVVDIWRRPVVRLAPTARYSESMCIGLYGWWGDQIPDASIVKDLEFVSIDTGGVTKMWCAFDWGLCRGEKPHITLLEEDPLWRRARYPFFNTECKLCLYTHYIPFDGRLCRSILPKL
jgi:hypothetical protein